MKITKQKIIDYIEYDYGVNLPELKNKIINSQPWQNFTMGVLYLFGIIISILLAGSYIILIIGHPFGMFFLTYINLVLIIFAYFVYIDKISINDVNNYIDKIKIFIKIKKEEFNDKKEKFIHRR